MLLSLFLLLLPIVDASHSSFSKSHARRSLSLKHRDPQGGLLGNLTDTLGNLLDGQSTNSTSSVLPPSSTQLPSSSSSSNSCGGLLGLGLGCSPTPTPTPTPTTSSSSSSSSSSPTSPSPTPTSTSTPSPSSTCNGLLGLGLLCSDSSSSTTSTTTSSSPHSPPSTSSTPSTTPPPPSTPSTSTSTSPAPSPCNGLLGLGLLCPDSSTSTTSTTPSPPSTSTTPSTTPPPPSTPSTSTSTTPAPSPSSTCNGLLGLGLLCPDSSTSTTSTTPPPPSTSTTPSTTPPPPSIPSTSTSTTPTPSCLLGLGLFCSGEPTSTTSTTSNPPPSPTSTTSTSRTPPSSSPTSPTSTTTSSSTDTWPTVPPSLTTSSTSPPDHKTTTTSSTTTTTTSTSFTPTSTSSSSSSSNSNFNYLSTVSSLLLNSPPPRPPLTLTNPDLPTTTTPLNSVSPLASPSLPPLPSGLPRIILPQPTLDVNSLPSTDVMITILFNDSLNWAFVAQNAESAGQFFEYVPSIISTALGIDVGEVHNYELSVYEPSSYTGPADVSELKTTWQGYIPKDDVSTLASLIANQKSTFYTGQVGTIPTELAQCVDPTLQLNSIQGPTPGGGGSTSIGSSSSGSNVRQDAIIGVVSSLGAVAVLIVAYVCYKAYQRRKANGHRRLSEATGNLGVRPEGQEFDRDSVGGQRRRSFYYAEDSLRGYQSSRADEDGYDHHVTGVRERRQIQPGTISTPILRESTMNW